MALQEMIDYVFVRKVDTPLEEGTFVGTKDYLCVIPHSPDLDRSFWSGVRAADRLDASRAIDPEAAPETVEAAVQHVLAADHTTLESLREFLAAVRQNLEVTRLLDVSQIERLKVRAGWFDSGIALRVRGTTLWNNLVTRIGKPQRGAVRAFYADVMARLDMRRR